VKATGFLSREGGTPLFGVDGDDDACRVVGLEGNPAELQRRVNDLVQGLVVPNPPCTVTAQQIDGRSIIRVDVEPNQGVLFALTVEANRSEYYVRRNGSTYFARPEELAALLRARAPGTESR